MERTSFLEMMRRQLLTVGRLRVDKSFPLARYVYGVASKAEPFSTNLFVWYGEHNFGQINLKRAKGVLEVHVNPPADLLTIRGRNSR